MKKVNIRKFPPLSYASAEAINTLCTNLSFAGDGVKKIMITSCHASEGKSFITMNVMRSLAKLGKTVVLVDADLRRSVITSQFGLQFSREEETLGLSHFLAGMADTEEVIYRTDIDNAFLVPVGRTVSNSLPLLSSPRFGALLNGLEQIVDYVLVDAPPVGLIIDAAEIAKSCDGTVIAVEYNSVHRRDLIEVKRQLEQSGTPILGVALNKVELDSYMSRKYYYKNYSANYEAYVPKESRGKKNDK